MQSASKEMLVGKGVSLRCFDMMASVVWYTHRAASLSGRWGLELCTARIFGFLYLNVFMVGFVYSVLVGWFVGLFCLCLPFFGSVWLFLFSWIGCMGCWGEFLWFVGCKLRHLRGCVGMFSSIFQFFLGCIEVCVFLWICICLESFCMSVVTLLFCEWGQLSLFKLDVGLDGAFFFSFPIVGYIWVSNSLMYYLECMVTRLHCWLLMG